MWLMRDRRRYNVAYRISICRFNGRYRHLIADWFMPYSGWVGQLAQKTIKFLDFWALEGYRRVYKNFFFYAFNGIV
jgi:hypothetical protein